MLDLGTRYQIALLQSQLLEWKLLQSQGLIERKEDWRDAEVVRDATGRFASTGRTLSKVADDIKSGFSPDHLKEIEKSIHNSLSNGTLEVRNILDNAFGNGAAAWRKEVADSFGDMTKGLRGAILKNPFPVLTKQANEAIARLEQYSNKAIDAATQNAISKEVASLFNRANTQYDKTIYDLGHLEGKPKVVQLLGKAAAELIPQAIFIGGFYFGGLLANWAIFAALFPAGVAVAGVGTVGARIPPLTQISRQVALLTATSEVAKLDREARGIDEEALKNMPWWKRAGEETRSVFVYLFASAGIAVGLAAIDGTLIRFGKDLVKEAAANALARKNMPAEIKATLAEVRKSLPRKEKLVEQKIAQLAEHYKDSKPMPAQVAAHVYKRAVKFERDLLNRFKDVPELPELVEAANINIQRAIHEAEIHVRAPDPAVPQILNSRFKTTFETNSRTLKGYMQKRSRVEKNFFGIDKEWPPEERPIYGYFARPGNTAKLEGANTDGYGAIALKLKPSTKRRATFLGHDSFWANDMGSIASTHDVPTVGTFLSGQESKAETVRIISELAKAKDIEAIRQVAGTVKIPGSSILAKASYLEAVVHGGVDGSEVAEVIFPHIPKNRVLAFEKLAKVRKDSGQDLGDEYLNAIIDTINTAREKGIPVIFGG